MVIQFRSIQRFAGSVRKNVSSRGKKVGLEKLEMKEAELLIKQRAREKEPELFYEIEHLDLIAKNFRFHEHCRKDFTRPNKSSNPVSWIFLPK